jgi:hypothetical protein
MVMEISVDEPCAYVHVMRSSWTIGIDLGQAVDPSAIAAVQRLRWHATNAAILGAQALPGFELIPLAALDGKRPPDELHVRALKRLPLGVSYIEQMQQIAMLLQTPALEGAQVFVDAGGVGRPVIDLFKSVGIRYRPVWITGGRDEQPHEGGFTVPKLHLISRLQAALHSGELKIAKALPEAKAFTRELQEFRATWTESGNLRFNARQGAHDDLLIACAIAVYGATRPVPAMTCNIPVAW